MAAESKVSFHGEVYCREILSCSIMILCLASKSFYKTTSSFDPIRLPQLYDVKNKSSVTHNLIILLISLLHKNHSLSLLCGYTCK